MRGKAKMIRAETRRTRGLIPGSAGFSAISASPRETDLECMFKEKHETQN